MFVNHLFGKRDFVGRQKLTVDFVDAEGTSDGFTDIFLVAGQHDGLADAMLFQGGKRFCCVRLHCIGNIDDTGIGAVNGRIQGGFDA